MSYDINWVVPVLRKPIKFQKIWNFASSFTFVCVGIVSKIIFEWLNKPAIYNRHRMIAAVTNRPAGVPLLTVSNHHSCFDDPGLWGVLKIRTFMSRYTMRWSLAAHDICFTNKYHSFFFMLGKCVPVVRGNGVYQPAVDFCIEQLSKGQWVHVFPEGKVNMTKEHLRLKWGVGRLVYESAVPPIILPIWHLGMETILPNYPPYYLRFGKKVTLNVGKPLDLTDTITELKRNNVPEQDARKILTDKIQDSLMVLQKETEKLHEAYVGQITKDSS